MSSRERIMSGLTPVVKAMHIYRILRLNTSLVIFLLRLEILCMTCYGVLRISPVLNISLLIWWSIQ